MKLQLPEIRKEAFEVKTSVKNIKKMHAYQLELAKSREELELHQDGTIQDLTKAITLDDMHYIERTEKFIIEILGLTEEEIDQLENFERMEFVTLQSKLVLALQGYDDSEITTVLEEGEKDAKKKKPSKKEKSITTIK